MLLRRIILNRENDIQTNMESTPDLRQKGFVGSVEFEYGPAKYEAGEICVCLFTPRIVMIKPLRSGSVYQSVAQC